MNDFSQYPSLMWMLTTAVLAVTITAAVLQLVAALVPERKGI